MADRYRDYDRDRDDRPGEAWRERDERWRAGEHDRPLTDRASDEVRSWFGDDEARRRREMDERRDESGRWRSDRGRYESSARDYDRERSWTRPEYGTTYDRDRTPNDERARWERGSASDLNRERDFGRSDRYANADEGMRYGSRTSTENRGESYRGTSGYETGRGAGSFGSWDRLGEGRSLSSSREWETGPFFGRGPRGYQRSDERINEEICERLTRHGRIDASDIEVRVTNGEVTLAGSVDDRESKRLADDVAESVFGVRDVNNQIKVYRRETEAVGTAGRDRGQGSEARGQGSETRGQGIGGAESTGSVLGLAGTANTPEITPPDTTGERKKP